jgi:hypothetical protein
MSSRKALFAPKPLLLLTMSLIISVVLGISLSVGQSGFFQSLGVGEAPGSRGEQLRVRGWSVFGVAGQQGGAITFMPPDGTGFYSIDNPGGQRLRISGGSRPGTHEYVTIQHPGHVRINGTLQVTGGITDAGGQPLTGGVHGHGMGSLNLVGGQGKADNTEALQYQVDELRIRVNELVKRVNAMQ